MSYDIDDLSFVNHFITQVDEKKMITGVCFLKSILSNLKAPGAVSLSAVVLSDGSLNSLKTSSIITFLANTQTQRSLKIYLERSQKFIQIRVNFIGDGFHNYSADVSFLKTNSNMAIIKITEVKVTHGCSGQPIMKVMIEGLVK